MPWLLRMTLLVSLLMTPAVLYLMWRLYVSGRYLFSVKKGVRYILPVLLCSFYLFPAAGTIDFYLTGDIEVLNYPKPLTYWFWFGLVFVFQLTTWVLVTDLVKFVSWIFSWHKQQIAHLHARVVLILFLLVFCYTGWKVYTDTTQIITEEISLSVENLPETLHGFRIVHISDIQGDEYTGRDEIAEYVRNINEQEPDLVIFTGDLVSYGTDFIRMSAQEFGRTEAANGVYAVVGDHDYWAGTEHVERALEEAGIPLLQDENATIPVDSSVSAVITGVTEVYSQRSSPGVVDSLTSNAEDAALKIMASHQVSDRLISSSQSNNYDMLLAGHTHGGQIQVPFFGMSFSAAARETPYVSGLYREGTLPININNGLGFTLGPIRYNAPPTVTVIELQSE